MRNLKKILALVLALVMALSLMTVASAKSLDEYTDGASVDAKYATAVDFTTQLGVLQGMSETTYAPKGTLTRAQLATMIYRITTGDVEGKYVANYAAGAATKFTDVPATHWAAGYIAYCADAGYLKGMGNDKYSPNSELTGYQALAALLRAIGYNQPGQFTGSDWTVQVAEIAYAKKVVNGVFADLSKALTREQAAQLVFNTMWAEEVTYTPLLNYYPNSKTLVKDVFGIVSDKDGVAGVAIDNWGRPAKVWYKGQEVAGKEAVVIADKAINKYTVATTECVIASDLGLKLNEEVGVTTYVNGKANKTTTYINAVDTVNKVGAQGQLVEVYADRLVVIDTFLANVDAVAPATFDAAGHLKTEATLCLTVYDKAEGTKVVVTNGATNYAYTAGQKLLVNAQTAAYNNDAVKVGTANAAGYAAPALFAIAGVSNSVVGAQTIIWQNAAKHTVAGVTYDDAVQFHKDVAANTATANFTWHFDQYGNLIGSFDIKTVYDYATIANIQWINPIGSYGYAQATLVYVNGTTETVVVDYIDLNGDWKLETGEKLRYSEFMGDYETSAVSANYAYNGEFIGQKLFAVAKGTGVVTLSEVQDAKSNVTVAKGNPVVTTGVYVDDATQFLVRTTVNGVYTWTPVTGYNQISTLEKAYIAYVNLDTDIAAEIAYVYGTAPAASAVSNLVYIANDSYNYVAGTTDFINVLGAQIKGEAATVVINTAWMDKSGKDLKVGSLYFMVDKNGDGKIDALTKSGDKETCVEITTDAQLVGDGVYAKKVAKDSYTVLVNALQVADEAVDYNILGATTYGTWTGAEDIVIVYKNHVVSAIYVL